MLILGSGKLLYFTFSFHTKSMSYKIYCERTDHSDRLVRVRFQTFQYKWKLKRNFKANYAANYESAVIMIVLMLSESFADESFK